MEQPDQEETKHTTEEKLRRSIFDILFGGGCDEETATRIATDTAYQNDDHAQE